MVLGREVVEGSLQSQTNAINIIKSVGDHGGDLVWLGIRLQIIEVNIKKFSTLE